MTPKTDRKPPVQDDPSEWLDVLQQLVDARLQSVRPDVPSPTWDNLVDTDVGREIKISPWLWVMCLDLVGDRVLGRSGSRLAGGRTAKPATAIRNRLIDWRRVKAVEAGLAQGLSKRRSFMDACNALKDTPAAGTARVMEQAYERVRRDPSRVVEVSEQFQKTVRKPE